MVLWIKKHKTKLVFLLASCILALLFTLPYLMKDLLPIEHDTFFHLSRIEGLAKAIENKDFLPAIYPDKNNGFGYTSPLFYADILLTPAALIHLAGLPLSATYKLVIFIETMFAAFAVMCLIYRITKKNSAAIIAATAYTFANYHITDVYVRGALGEVQAMIFLPILLEGIYILLYEQDEKQWKCACFSLTVLALTHNLTFLLSVILCSIFFLIRLSHLKKAVIIAVFKAVILAFLLSAFFTLPMLEQLSSNDYYLNYYGTTSDLADGALPLWKYFANTTVFGYSSTALSHDQQMLVNPGYFLTFAPLLYIFAKEKKPFITTCMVPGCIFLLLPSDIIPWDMLSFLRILQFPWRLIQLSMLLLTIPAAYAFTNLCHKKAVHSIVISLLVIEGIWHVLPVTSRTFGLTSDITWSDVTDGALTDPYYSATYMRVELAGGDYLPLSSPDYRELSPVIMDENMEPTDIPFERQYNTLEFTIDSETTNKEIVLPRTWYKGYTIVDEAGNEIPCYQNDYGLVSFTPETSGTYTCCYKSTPLRNCSIIISVISFLLFACYTLYKKRHHA